MFFSASVPFTEPEVADYERRRYRGLDQRLVHAREARILKKFLLKAGLMQPGRLLDVPCGYGRFTTLLRQEGTRVVCSDLSLAMVKRARLRPGTGRPPAAAVADVKRGLPFRDGSFGLVLSVRFFHHLHQPRDRQAALQEFARVTSRWAVVSYYRINLFHRLQRKLRRTMTKGRTQIKMLTSREFNKEAAKAGFRVVQAAPLFRPVHAQTFVLLEKLEKEKARNSV